MKHLVKAALLTLVKQSYTLVASALAVQGVAQDDISTVVAALAILAGVAGDFIVRKLP